MEQTAETQTETKSSVETSNEGGGTSEEKETKDKQLTAPQKFIKLKRDLNAMVSNIQAAAEAREAQWRAEIEKARKARLEILEDHTLISKNKIEEISNGWHTAKEKVTPQEVHAMLVHQEQLCAEVIAHKKKVTDAIQQELKARDDSFVTDLKKQTEELQLMLERMMEQDNTLTKAYRDELEQWKETVQNEEETKRTEEKTEWEKCIKKLLDTEVEKIQKRQQTVEEYNTTIYNMAFVNSDNSDIFRNKTVAAFQKLELEIHQIESESIFLDREIDKEKADTAKLKAVETQLKAKLSSTMSELTKLRLNEQTGKDRNKNQRMEKRLKELNRKAQDYERLQKKILHYALADAITFENMWLTLNAEVKELMERALFVDSMIYKQVLCLAWEQPNLSFMEPGRRLEERCGASQTSEWNQDPSVAAHTDAGNRDASLEGFYNESESASEVGSAAANGNVMTPRTVKTVMELLCDEADFLFEVKLVKFLDNLPEQEMTPVKMSYLFNTLGIEEKDVPKLVNFLYKYGQQHPKESEDTGKAGPSCSVDEIESSSVSADTSDLIDRNEVLHALKCFLDQNKQGSNNNIPEQWSVQSVEAHDRSKEEAYWESIGNVITPDKLKIWEVTQKKLEKHHAVLSEISTLNLEIQNLQQENTELQMVCMLLQQLSMDQPLSLSPDATQIHME